LFVYPFTFNEYTPLIGRLSSETRTITALVRYSAALELKPELKLIGVLKNQSSGQEDVLPASIRSGGEYQTTDKTIRSIVFLIEFQLPPKTGSGAYTLKITAEEKKTQLKTEFTGDLRID
jgi:hypothetical protein